MESPEASKKVFVHLFLLIFTPSSFFISSSQNSSLSFVSQPALNTTLTFFYTFFTSFFFQNIFCGFLSCRSRIFSEKRAEGKPRQPKTYFFAFFVSILNRCHPTLEITSGIFYAGFLISYAIFPFISKIAPLKQRRKLHISPLMEIFCSGKPFPTARN